MLAFANSSSSILRGDATMPCALQRKRTSGHPKSALSRCASIMSATHSKADNRQMTRWARRRNCWPDVVSPTGGPESIYSSCPLRVRRNRLALGVRSYPPSWCGPKDDTDKHRGAAEPKASRYRSTVARSREVSAWAAADMNVIVLSLADTAGCTRRQLARSLLRQAPSAPMLGATSRPSGS